MKDRSDLSPEELELLLQQEAAIQAAQQQSQVTGDPGVMQVLGEVADTALDMLTDTAVGAGDMVCSVAGGAVEVVGGIIGALFD